MLPSQHLYEKVMSEDVASLSCDEERETTSKSISKRPRLSTVILLIATLAFGLHSMYLTFWKTNNHSNLSFDRGYLTEWGNMFDERRIENRD